MGHLRLAMPPAKYAAQNGGSVYEASPINPGPYDDTIVNNAGSVQRSRREAHHQQRLENHLIEQATQKIIENRRTSRTL